ncbi:telomeric repeat binding protein 1 [Striga asiatica]|uniref:Telomeric repeat binding protein 1 n=1 Tax=Striga asiatica TaxID=4170 RepID=A0A5A7NYB3_STRAF|nr:telomeric repeat binding protein 1 [Striga asiatica]
MLWVPQAGILLQHRTTGRNDLGNYFALFLHHGGRFVTIENTKEYFGGDDSFRYGFDIDRFGYFDLEEEVKKVGYSEWAICSESENEDANDKSDSKEDTNDFIDNYNIGVQDELEQPKGEEPTRRVLVQMGYQLMNLALMMNI